METNDLLIRQFVFDLDIEREDQFNSINDALLGFVKERGEAIFEKIVTEFDPNQNIIIDELEIQIDNFDVFDLEYLEQQIMDQVLAKIKNFYNSPREQKSDLTVSMNLEQLLLFIARYGFLPWRFNQPEKIKIFFEKQWRKPLKRDQVLSVLSNKKGFLRIYRVMESKHMKLLLKVGLGKHHALYQTLIQIEKKILLKKGKKAIEKNLKDTAFFLIERAQKASFLSSSILIEALAYIKEKYALQENETKRLFSGREAKKWIPNFPSSEKKWEQIIVEELVQLFVVIENKQLIKVSLKSNSTQKTIFKNEEILKGDLKKALQWISQIYQNQHGYSFIDVIEILRAYIIQKKQPSLFEKKILKLVDQSFDEESFKNKDSQTIHLEILPDKETKTDRQFNALNGEPEIDQQSNIKNFITDKQESISTAYFDFIINVNNQISEPSDKNAKKETIFLSLTSILKSTKTLLSFLSSYQKEDRILTLFSRISLTPEHNSVFIDHLKKKFSSWLQIEKELLRIHKQIIITDVEERNFVFVLRYFLIRTLAYHHKDKAWAEGVFTYHFLNYIQKQTQVHFNKIRKYIQTQSNNLLPEIEVGFETFTETNPYGLMPLKKRKDLYYKELFFSYLKNDDLPFWSVSQSVDEFEIIQFLSLMIKQKEEEFLKLLLSNVSVRKTLFPLLKKQKVSYYKKMVPLLVDKQQKKEIVEIVYLWFDWAEAGAFSPFFIFENTIKMKPWLRQSVGSFKKQLLTKIQKEYPSLNNNTPLVYKPLFEIRQDYLHSNNIDDLLLHFVTEKKLPNAFKNETEKYFELFRKHLLNNSTLTLSLFQTFYQSRSSKNKILYEVFTKNLITEVMKAALIKNKLYYNSFVSFLELLEKVLPKEYQFFAISMQFFQILKDGKSEIHTAINTVLISLHASHKEYFNVMVKELSKIPDLKSRHSEKKIFGSHKEHNKKVNFNIVVHYIEVGSLPKENEDLSLQKLYSFLEKAPFLLAQKYVYGWLKMETQRNRLFSLVTEKKQIARLLEFAHPSIFDLIFEMPSLFNQLGIPWLSASEFKKSLKEITTKILQAWASIAFNQTTPYLLITTYIKQELEKLEIEKIHFQKQLETTAINSKLDKQKILEHFDSKNQTLKQKNIEIQNVELIKDKELKDGIAVQNAGLVIAWPFLSTLFSKLGLLENKKIKDDLSMQKALLATHYLVYGNREVDENQLVLNKILCGTTLDFFINTDISLDEMEKGICDMALKSIIGQWGKVKSVATLRDSFLQRNGVLKAEDENNFTLIVEKETRDILLRFIPWNLSIIKTTLMQSKLVIDWKFK
jgi:hypothetical protein